MRVVVLGAGLIGVLTAYYLAEDGHEVVVVDRQAAVGLETSFANGALITPSTSDSWAAPGTPLKILKWLGREEAPLLLRPAAFPAITGWALRFLANCRSSRWRANTAAVLALALYSLQELHRLLAKAAIDFDRNQPGLLKLFRDPISMDSARRAGALYQELGVDARLLTPGQCSAIEPALAPIEAKISGGLFYPADESGDSWKFVTAVAQLCRARGVDFRLSTRIEALSPRMGRVGGVATDRGVIGGDAYVLALGSYSPGLARGLGVALPIYPAKGYSITVDAARWNAAPRIPIADDGRKMAVAPLGARLRVAGTVEFAGHDLALNAVRGRMLVDGLGEILPHYPRGAPITHWAGLRPMTPDGRPIIGRTPLANLFVNSGHGPLGWTLACGSGRALADLMQGKTPAIDLAAFALARR
jgi:D-amino-acid dehydrogenase